MALPNIFEKEVSDRVIERIQALKPDTRPQWGKMNVGQMLAHCSVMYHMVYGSNLRKPNPIMRWMMKTFVKKMVTSEKPYKKNLRTAPAFIINDDRNFEKEKTRLIEYIDRTQKAGETSFDQKESLSFGALSVTEWNNMFYKHLNHHLTQFGV